MSLEQVKGFYQRLASDEAFQTQIQGVKSKEECSQIVKTAGFNFTQNEFEDYTAQFIEPDNLDSEIQDLNKQELETVVGGFSTYVNLFQPLPCYGGPPITYQRF